MELVPASVFSTIVQGYARVLARFGRALGTRPMVLPTAEFFPDRFVGDEQSVANLIGRMKDHAGLGALELGAQIAGAKGPCHAGGCGGDCAPSIEASVELERLVRTDDGWQLRLRADEVRVPEVLTTHVARALALAFLATEEPGRPVPAHPAVVDLAAVALGFGALMMEGSYVYRKACHGASVARFTALGCEELAVAFALFVASGRHARRRALTHLGTTQRARLREALTWADSNPELVRRLVDAPARVAAGDFELDEPRPFLLRLLGRKGKRARTDAAPDTLLADATIEQWEAALTGSARGKRPVKPVDPELEEIRRLVDEALGDR